MRKHNSLYCRLVMTVGVLALFPDAYGQSADVAADSSGTAVHDIVVHASKDKTDTEEGFISKKADLGPLGTLSQLDTPYTVSVVTKDFIENYHATSLSEMMKYVPSAQMEARGGMDVGRPQIRGMEGSVVDNNHLDGLNVVSTTAQPVEMLERVEFISGLTGSIYGPASPAGDFNYVLKRPTYDYFNKLTAGVSKDGAYTVAVDLGGTPIRYAGYRINSLIEQGDGYVSGSRIDRKLFSGAFDFHIHPGTLLEVNASFYRFRKFGYPGSFAYASGVSLPDAVDPTKKGYGQKFGGSRLKTWTESATLKQDLGHGWTLSLGGLNQVAERLLMAPTNTINSDGTMTTKISLTGGTPQRFEVLSNRAAVNGSLQLFGMTHDIMLGTSGYSWDIFKPAGRSTATLGTTALDSPTTYDAPTFLRSQTVSKKSNISTQSGMAGDTIRWGPFSLMLLGSYQHFHTSSYSSGSKSGGYGSDGFSNNISLMYKPTSWLMGYISHADTLESGGQAGDDAENANEVLNPVRSISTEVGAKADFGRFNSNLALFHTTRPMAYTGDDNYYRVQGLQRNNGVEFNISGNVWKNLRLMAGATYLDAKLKKAYSTSAENKRVVGVPHLQANIMLEDELPQIKGLFFNANLHYTGKRAANSANTTYADSYYTLDLGMRYEMPRDDGHALVFRINATNVTGENYWASIFPGKIYGLATASNSAFLGDPMGVHMSVSLKY